MFVDIDRWPWQSAPAPTEIPLFAIGDIHGRHDLLVALLTHIRETIETDRLRGALLVLLGDYFSRGPKSLAVLNTVFSDKPLGEIVVIPLPGNHEQMFMQFLSATSDLSRYLNRWFGNGGVSVAAELGWRGWEAERDPAAFQEALRKRLGENLMGRISRAPNHFRSGPYLFVHAGIHPKLGLSMLNENWSATTNVAKDRDPLWIRAPFLRYRGEFEDALIVVHGHTPHSDPEFRPNRINLDTRAFESGRLTAIQILGSQMRIIQACGDVREKAGGWI